MNRFPIYAALGIIGVLIVGLLITTTVVAHDRSFRKANRQLTSQPFDHPNFNQMGQGKVGRHRDGLIGTVTRIDGNNLTVHTNEKDYTVTIADSTSIYKSDEIAKQSDITANAPVIVRGAPNSSGQIAAKVIELP